MSDETKELAIIEEHTGLQLGSQMVDNYSMVVGTATGIAKELSKIIKDKKLFKKIGPKEHIYIDGWTTLGAMLGIVPVEREVVYTDHEGFFEYEAHVDLIRTSDGEKVGGASSICGSDEDNWCDRPRYAVRSMAVTRATGKAFRLGYSWIVVLAGYSPTPAEEMDGVIIGGFKEEKKSPKAILWDRAQELGVDGDTCKAILKEVKNDYGDALVILNTQYAGK